MDLRNSDISRQIKGVEVGDAFANTRLPGTQAQDAMTLERSTLNVQRRTNRAGGIEGGISHGQPIVVRAAMKPIATTLQPQSTVDLALWAQNLSGNTNVPIFVRSRAAVPILEAMVAFVLADCIDRKTRRRLNG